MVVSMLRFALIVLTCLLGVVLLSPRTAKDASRPAVEAANGIVVSTHRLASEAGIAMLQQGGNAIDAAVAIGYAEAVVDPCCGNIGGGGFLVAHLRDGGDVFLNFRETAPAAATRDMYLDEQGNAMYGASLYGWRAVAVPGTVMGLDTALTRYGTLPRSVVMAPAISLARDGFELTRFDTDILQRSTAMLRRDVSASRIFLHPDGSPLGTGRASGAARAGGNPRIDRRGWATGGRRRDSVPRQQWDRHLGRLRRIPRYTIYAIVLQLSWLCVPFRAAALLRRCHAVRDPARSRGLRHADAGLSFRPDRARDDRGDATRLFRSQHLSRRSCFCDQPSVEAAVVGPCGGDPRTNWRSGHTVGHIGARYRTTRAHGDDALFDRAGARSR